MLREIAPRRIKQYPNEPSRRWFLSDNLDITVWSDNDGNVTKFELCYHHNWQQKALTWSQSGGFRHENIDSGEDIPGKPKQTPITYADGAFAKSKVLQLFALESSGLEQPLSAFILARLEQY